MENSNQNRGLLYGLVLYGLDRGELLSGLYHRIPVPGECSKDGCPVSDISSIPIGRDISRGANSEGTHELAYMGTVCLWCGDTICR